MDKRFIRYLSKRGTQGIVGLLKDDNDEHSVFKLSKYIDYAMDHELLVFNDLRTISYLPHFIKMKNSFLAKIDTDYLSKENPFKKTTKRPIDQRIITMELVYGKSLVQFVKKSLFQPPHITSIMQQIICSLAIAQQQIDFTHYDLHASNIMIRPCSRNKVNLYIVNPDLAVCVPTYGNEPVFIDYGYAYTKSVGKSYLYACHEFMHVGIKPTIQNKTIDISKILVSVCEYVPHNQEEYKRFHRITKHILKDYNPFQGIRGSESESDSSSEDVDERLVKLASILSEECDESTIFSSYTHLTLTIMQGIIKLPLKPSKKPVDKLASYFIIFVHEFAKIEREIHDNMYSLHILRVIVDAVRDLETIYSYDKPQAIAEFQKKIQTALNSIVSFCSPKDVNYERMFCCLLLFGDVYSSILYNFMISSKYHEYIRLPDVKDILNAFGVNVQHTYHFNPDQLIDVYDSVQGTTYKITIDKDIAEELNMVHPVKWTDIILNYHKQHAIRNTPKIKAKG